MQFWPDLSTTIDFNLPIPNDHSPVMGLAAQILGLVVLSFTKEREKRKLLLVGMANLYIHECRFTKSLICYILCDVQKTSK